jgi:hypothetical protein
VALKYSKIAESCSDDLVATAAPGRFLPIGTPAGAAKNKLNSPVGLLR